MKPLRDLLRVEVFEVRYGAWPKERWVVPAEWWLSTVERGRWSECCRIGFVRFLALVCGRWPGRSGGREPGYWPIRVRLGSMVIWRSRALSSLRAALETEAS